MAPEYAMQRLAQAGPAKRPKRGAQLHLDLLARTAEGREERLHFDRR